MLIPDLQRDLVEAAGQLTTPRRRVRAGMRVAAAAVVAAVLTVTSVMTIGGPSSDKSSVPRSPRSNSTSPPQGTVPPSRRGPQPLPGSLSDPIEFSFAGDSHLAVGFRGRGGPRQRGGIICTRLMTEVDNRPSLVGASCAGERLLRRALAREPLFVYAGGGSGPTSTAGFARESVLEIRAIAPSVATRVVLSEPWRPKPWRGEPIRFVYVLSDAKPDTGPGARLLPLGVQLQAQLSNGEVVEVPAPGGTRRSSFPKRR
jgi:hypothetical protein